MKNPQNAEQSASAPVPPRGRLRLVVNILLCVLFVAAGLAGGRYIQKSAPKARKRPPVKAVPLVETLTVQPSAHQVLVPAMGTVIPAREMVLRSRVSGEVVSIHSDFVLGGFMAKGTEMLRIDPADYKLAAAQKQSAVSAAEYALKLEMGHQEVAKREWELINDNQAITAGDDELALRKPHLDKARADLTAAQAALEQARLNLGRTTIRAPFNAMVRGIDVVSGSQVSVQDRLAELVGTDVYWVRVSIPVDRLSWIEIPRANGDQGAMVRIIYRTGTELEGRIVKLLADLETEGRMARVLVAVKDPLNRKAKPGDSQGDRPPLLLGEYVRVLIQGRRLENVYAIPRSALRDNAAIWIAGVDDRLEIRPVNPVWRGEGEVLLRDGLQPGERVIVSTLATPVGGMPIKTVAAGEASPVAPAGGDTTRDS